MRAASSNCCDWRWKNQMPELKNRGAINVMWDGTNRQHEAELLNAGRRRVFELTLP